LDQRSKLDESTSPLTVLEGQLRESFGRVVYSHKTHEKCADILLSRLSTLKTSQIILSAATTAGLISVVFGSSSIGAALGLLVSTVLLILNAYTKDYDLGELAQKHRQAATDLWLIREKYLSLLTDLRTGDRSPEDLRRQRNALLEQLHSVYAGAPSTTYKAYKKAQHALQQLEDMTFSDAEIDAFLPAGLKKTFVKPTSSN
jgi:hypothetical protein